MLSDLLCRQLLECDPLNILEGEDLVEDLDEEQSYVLRLPGNGKLSCALDSIEVVHDVQ